MNELIPINYNNDRQTVTGRDLHTLLEVETPYDKWFPRMTEYGFNEGIDFTTFLSESTGGRPATNHQITIEMAKELCMLQRTEKGKQARQYFIELEKAWNSPESVMARAVKMADAKILSLQGRVDVLQQTIEQQKPLILFAETCIASNDSLLVREVAKLASKQGAVIGEKRLWQKLREWEVVSHTNEPYQRAMDAGWFEIRQGTYNTPYGSETYRTPKVTPKGQIYIIEKLKKELAH
jgi:anti-repressor protein